MKKCVLSLGVVLLLSFPVSADLIPVDQSYWSGSRTTPASSGIFGTGRWADDSGGLRIIWSIEQNLEGFYEYSYSVVEKSGEELSPTVSHLLLELSDTITSENFNDVIWDISGQADPESEPMDIRAEVEGPDTWTADPDSPDQTIPGANKGNPNLPEDIYGIKLPGENEDGTTMFTIWAFTSSRLPVWGDIYFKDGRAGCGSVVDTAWNSGIGTNPTALTTDFTGWVPVPDTNGYIPPDGVIPEPATLALLGMGLTSLLVCRGRRRKR